MSEESKPRLIYSKRGLMFVAFLMALGVILAYLGSVLEIFSMLIWGLLIIISTTLSLIPIAARLATYKALISRLEEAELEAKIEERLRKRKTESAEGEIASAE